MPPAQRLAEPPDDDDRRIHDRQRRRAGGRRLTDLADPTNPAYLRVSAVAEYFSVDRRTVEKWAHPDRDGKIPLPIQRYPYADRIAIADIRRFVEKHKVYPEQKPHRDT